MSQTVRFTEINDVFYRDILHAFPNRSESIDMIMELAEEKSLSLSDDEFCVETYWFEIGKGESDTDELVKEADLIKWYSKGGIDEVRKQVNLLGYEIEHIQSHEIYIDKDDILKEYQDFGIGVEVDELDYDDYADILEHDDFEMEM